MSSQFIGEVIPAMHNRGASEAPTSRQPPSSLLDFFQTLSVPTVQSPTIGHMAGFWSFRQRHSPRGVSAILLVSSKLTHVQGWEWTAGN